MATLEETAHHEAGHLVYLDSLKMDYLGKVSLCIRIENHGCSGEISCNPIDPINNAMVAMAGPIAALIHSGGNDGDLEWLAKRFERYVYLGKTDELGDCRCDGERVKDAALEQCQFISHFRCVQGVVEQRWDDVVEVAGLIINRAESIRSHALGCISVTYG